MTNPGLYTNRDNEPHENFVYQNLRSSRMENSQRDVLGERIRLLAHQLDISTVGDSVRSPEVPNQEDSNSMPALPNHNWAAGPSTRSPTRNLDQSHVIPSHDRTIQETQLELILIKPLEKKVIDERARKVKKCGNAEQQWYATERHKTPLVDLTEPEPVRVPKTKKRVMTVQDLEDDPMDEPDTILSDHSIQGSDSEWNEPGNRPPPTANKRRPYRHVPSPTHYRRRRRRKKKRNESEASLQESTMEENSSSRADSDDGDSSDDDSSNSDDSDDSSEEAEDTEEVDTSFENAQPGPSGRSRSTVRSSNRTPQKKSRRINSSVDEDEDDDDEDFDDEEPVKQSLSRRISRDRTSRRPTPLKNPTRSNSSKTINTAKRNLNSQPSKSIPTFQLADSTTDEQSADQLTQPAEIDGVSWIKHLTSLRTPFIPQINDEVFYSPGAHAKYCVEFEEKVGRLRVNERVPKEINKQNLMERLILCDVSSIEGML